LGRAWWSNVPPRSPGAVAVEWAVATAGTIFLQALLTPWWIDKRRVPVAPNPAAAIPWILFVIDALVRNAAAPAP
jgi:hypothetical protein